MAKRSNRARKRVTTTTTKYAFKGVEAQKMLASGKLFQWREKDHPRIFNAVEMPSYMQEALDFCASNPFVSLDDIAHNGLITHTEETNERIIFSKMTDEQLNMILPFLNKRCFKNPLTLEQLKEVFQYKRAHVQVKSVPVLACFFAALKEKGLLADGWQTTIEEKEMFLTKVGKPLTQKYIGHAIKNFKDQVEKHTLWKGYFEDLVIKGEIDQLKEEL